MTISYHGSKSEIRKFAVQKNQPGQQFGAGIYTAAEINLAKKYGHVIHICDVDLSNFVDESTPTNKLILEKIIKTADQQVLKKYNADSKLAVQQAVKDTACTNMVDSLYSVWHDIFRNDGVEFCKAAVQAGIAGVTVKAISSLYHIVFDPNKIKILDVQTL